MRQFVQLPNGPTYEVPRRRWRYHGEVAVSPLVYLTSCLLQPALSNPEVDAAFMQYRIRKTGIFSRKSCAKYKRFYVSVCIETERSALTTVTYRFTLRDYV
jgi:hypothetical protein